LLNVTKEIFATAHGIYDRESSSDACISSIV